MTREGAPLDLVRRAQAGEREAFDMLVERHLGSFISVYEVAMDGQALDEGDTGDVLSATASWAIDEDPAAYRLATAVMDRITASLVFDD